MAMHHPYFVVRIALGDHGQHTNSEPMALPAIPDRSALYSGP